MPAAERRRLAGQAVGQALHAGLGPVPTAAVTPTEALEEALQPVATGAGMPQKPTIAAAKAWLRSVGNGAPLASRIGRLSKGRNVHAHPGVSIVRDIEALLDNREEVGSTAGSPDTAYETELLAATAKDVLGDEVAAVRVRGREGEAPCSLLAGGAVGSGRNLELNRMHPIVEDLSGGFHDRERVEAADVGIGREPEAYREDQPEQSESVFGDGYRLKREVAAQVSEAQLVETSGGHDLVGCNTYMLMHDMAAPGHRGAARQHQRGRLRGRQRP